MFKLAAYKNGRFYGMKTGKNNVLNMLIQETTKPVMVEYFKRSVRLTYTDNKFTEYYTIPIEYYKGEK